MVASCDGRRSDVVVYIRPMYSMFGPGACIVVVVVFVDVVRVVNVVVLKVSNTKRYNSRVSYDMIEELVITT